MPELSAVKNEMSMEEVEDFFNAYELVLERTSEDCKRLFHIITAHPKYLKGFTIDDAKSNLLYNSCINIKDRWSKMDITDDELETRIEDFGVDPNEFTCAVEDATESTQLLSSAGKKKKKAFLAFFQKYKEDLRKRRLLNRPKDPEEPNVIRDRRKAICSELECIMREELENLKKADEESRDSPPSDSSPKPLPVKDSATLKIEDLANDAHILYYAAKTLRAHRKYSFDDLFEHLRAAYPVKPDQSFVEQPSKLLGREMDAMLKSKLCFEIMNLILEEKIKNDELFPECEKYYEEQQRSVLGAEGGYPTEKLSEKSSRKRTTDEPPQNLTASPAKQPRKAPGSSQQEQKTEKLVDVPSPTKEPKDVGTRRKQTKTAFQNFVISPPGTEKAGSDEIVRIPPPPSSKRSRSVPANINKPTAVSLIDFNSPQHKVPSEPDVDLIDFQSPKKQPENPPKKPEGDSDDENSTGVTKQLRRTSVEDQ